jgi:hypothetical protein
MRARMPMRQLCGMRRAISEVFCGRAAGEVIGRILTASDSNETDGGTVPVGEFKHELVAEYTTESGARSR